MLKSLLNKVADLKTCNFIKERLQHRCHEKETTEAVVRIYSSKFHRKIHVLESLFNKVPGLKTCNFIKKRLLRRCFPVKFPKFLRTPFLQSTSGDYF